MFVKILKKTIRSISWNKTQTKVPTKFPEVTSMTGTLYQRQDPPLASACDVGIFPLFDLPSDLVYLVIVEMVNTICFHRSTKLRAVNSKFRAPIYNDRTDKLEWFDDTVTSIIFTPKNAHLLCDRHCWSYTPPIRSMCTKILKREICGDVSPQTDLHRAINSCLDRIKSFQVSDLPSNEAANHHEICIGILCTSIWDVLSMKDAFQDLPAQNERFIESPMKGALVLASELGDIRSIETLVAHGASVDDKSSIFGCSVHAAGMYGHIDAVRALLKHCEPHLGHIYGAVKGGHRDIDLFRRFV